MLAGAGLLWMGWSGFNGGAPYAANINASIAVLNTNICAATSLLVWTSLDVMFFGKPSVIGAVQGMMTGLVCITPGAGLVQSWAAIVMGIASGSIPWVSMMVLHKKSSLLQKVKFPSTFVTFLVLRFHSHELRDSYYLSIDKSRSIGQQRLLVPIVYKLFFFFTYFSLFKSRVLFFL